MTPACHIVVNPRRVRIESHTAYSLEARANMKRVFLALPRFVQRGTSLKESSCSMLIVAKRTEGTQLPCSERTPGGRISGGLEKFRFEHSEY